jgi:hypothetical protein
VRLRSVIPWAAETIGHIYAVSITQQPQGSFTKFSITVVCLIMDQKIIDVWSRVFVIRRHGLFPTPIRLTQM